ncbi:DUF1835 domain-containing protein [Chitinophaga sancti]|uniref:DUF1835 domain-containing protein n=1 Tax=Chitinophaga sancti TaxID=1004 RepID=A0A1K1MMX0_9BACT|nr:DUF1835 domain-containing protein [Chitinophaga sancti]WQD62819.1 DUF1835 domain-containing protein [Chitinophaga sancti]WQG91557.1 DUF1835 domain-containing protein [Chitinophaga sancti]SFW24433.1 Protein of unknown function [Chitinophaga sancti]
MKKQNKDRMETVHIVFGESSVAPIQGAFELDEQLKGDILYFEDDLSIGPLFIIDTKDGQAGRRQWWNQLAGVEPAPAAPLLVENEAEAQPVEEETSPDPEKFKELKSRLKADPELQVWIWAGQNARDVSGYFWLVSQLYDFAGRIFIIYLNNLPFLNEKGGVFYPTHLHQILSKEFLKAKKLARAISLAEFELDGDEWSRLMNENAGIRLLEGGKKLRGEPVTFYDKDLLAASNAEFQKANKVINQVTGKMKYPVMDQYLGWRVKELVKQGKLESKGELKTSKDFEVKLV